MKKAVNQSKFEQNETDEEQESSEEDDNDESVDDYVMETCSE